MEINMQIYLCFRFIINLYVVYSDTIQQNLFLNKEKTTILIINNRTGYFTWQ